MKKIHKTLSEIFHDAEILENRKRGYYFVKPAFCDDEQEKTIKNSHPNINLINTKGADGECTVFLFKI